MPQNDFLPFAVGSGANVTTQDNWAGLPDRQTGFQAGTARSDRVNKALRQATAVAAVLGLFTTTRGPLAALDDGNIAALETAYATAVSQLVSSCGFANDVGVVNSLVINLTPSPTLYYEGLTIKFVPQTTNTGACTISVNSLGGRPILRRDGSPIAEKDLGQGNPYVATYIGGTTNGAFRLSAPAQSEVQKVAINPTLYVRPNGSDANDGSANADGKAFATLTAAFTYALTKLAYSGSQLQIVLGAAGTYAVPSFQLLSSGVISITTAPVLAGDFSQQGSYILSGSISAAGATTITITGVTIQRTTAGHLHCTAGAGMYLSYITFAGNNVTSGNAIMLYVPDGGQVRLGPGIRIAVSMPYAFRIIGGGGVTTTASIAIVGSLSYALAFVAAESTGHYYAAPGSSFDLSGGSASGLRYFAVTNGTIDTVGGGANFLPGSIAGQTQTGGQYV